MNRNQFNAGDEILAEINSRTKNAAGSSEETIDTSGDVIRKINRAIFEVSRELGSGFIETVYQNALMAELKEEKLKARSNVRLKVWYKGTSVGEYYAHIIVDDQIILDITMVDELDRIRETQLINCLKATGYKIGLLINFANEKAEIRRFSI
ncbi:MAG: GxxExxY protein [Syntrophus sp. (in: bacteria)]|nr:GxxExxY protein [Syntrophus sp. (in: bacteria)]